MSQLHQIDRPYGGYKLRDMEELLVFCILDTACTYNMVCKTFDELRANDMTTRKGIRNHTEKEIMARLRFAGYRFPAQHAGRIKAFGDNDVNLKTVSREDMVKNISGIGLKLASMFLRNTRDEDYAVLDVHTLRYVDKMGLKVYGKKGMKDKLKTYMDKEKFFRTLAQAQGKSVMELDLEIWQRERVKSK